MAVPANELRKYMLAAYDQGMVSGDYVFFDIDNLFEAGWKAWNETWDEEARTAAENLLIVSMVYFKSLFQIRSQPFSIYFYLFILQHHNYLIVTIKNHMCFKICSGYRKTTAQQFPL